MQKFFMQHVGEALARRDFPKSIGARPAHFLRFTFSDLQDMATAPLGFQSDEIERVKRVESFQIWGLPEGASPFTSQMFSGDWLMLLGSEKSCEYVGKVVARVPRLAPDISLSLWNEHKFPWIVLLGDSKFIDLDWSTFLSRVGYSENNYLRGKTSRVSEAKMRAAGVSGADELGQWVKSH